MSKQIRVGTALANPGEKSIGEIPIPSAYAGQIEAPQVVLIKGLDGPTVYFGAGSHGDEFNSMEAVRHAALAIDPCSIAGTVILVPVQNVSAFKAQTRTSPSDGKNLDRCYPGKLSGSPTEVLAYLLMNEAIRKADYILDLHTASSGGRNWLFAAIAPETPKAAAGAFKIAQMFGAHAIVARESTQPEMKGCLYVQASLSNIPATIIEFGEAGRLDRELVETGLKGIYNVLAHLGVLNVEPVSPPPPFVARTSAAIRCTTQGFLYLAEDVGLGQPVKKGQPVARVISWPDKTEEIRSECDGVVLRIATTGIVEPGTRVLVVARE